MYSRRFDTPLSHFSPDALQSELFAMLDPASRTWLQVARDKILDCRTLDNAVNALMLTSAMTRRKLGEEELKYQPEGTHWQVDQAGRLLLLLTLRSIVPSAQWGELLFSLYRQFDENEKIVTVRALDWLGENHDLNPIAMETTRTNDINLFAAIALNNSYPVKYFNERAFHQLVLKALFLDLNIQQIEGLPLRQSPELTQLCVDLTEERLRAAREVPTSIWLGMRYRYLTDTAKQMYMQYVFSESEEHQHYTLLALVNNGGQDCPPEFWRKLSHLQSSMPDETRMLADRLLSEFPFKRSHSPFSTTGHSHHEIL
ncbi:EboA domain-containing protein [Photobacterium sp. R1]